MEKMHQNYLNNYHFCPQTYWGGVQIQRSGENGLDYITDGQFGEIAGGLLIEIGLNPDDYSNDEMLNVYYDVDNQKLIKTSTVKVSNVIGKAIEPDEKIRDPRGWYYNVPKGTMPMEGNGPFEGFDLHLKTSLGLPGGFAITQTWSAYEYGGGGLDGRYNASLTWGLDGTGAYVGATGYWDAQFENRGEITLVTEGGIKYRMLYATLSNTGLTLDIGYQNKSSSKAFLEGLLGKDFNTSVLLGVGFSIDITDLLEQGMTIDEVLDMMRPQLKEAFLLLEKEFTPGN